MAGVERVVFQVWRGVRQQ